MAIQTGKAPSSRGITQARQGRTDQGRAPVASVKKLQGRRDPKPSGPEALASGGHLARNRVRFGWLRSRHSRIDSGLDGMPHGGTPSSTKQAIACLTGALAASSWARRDGLEGVRRTSGTTGS
jgi:hypothetical protein